MFWHIGNCKREKGKGKGRLATATTSRVLWFPYLALFMILERQALPYKSNSAWFVQLWHTFTFWCACTVPTAAPHYLMSWCTYCTRVPSCHSWYHILEKIFSIIVISSSDEYAITDHHQTSIIENGKYIDMQAPDNKSSLAITRICTYKTWLHVARNRCLQPHPK